MPSAFLLINCKLGSDKEVISRLKEIPVVIQVYRVYGAYDIIIRVAAGTVEKATTAIVLCRIVTPTGLSSCVIVAIS
jgi:DNA-binding Lrp family transcriptional regulator